MAPSRRPSGRRSERRSPGKSTPDARSKPRSKSPLRSRPRAAGPAPSPPPAEPVQEAPWEVVPVEPPPRASAESPPRTSAESPTPAPAPSRVLPPALPACGLGGAVILAVSQFLVLYRTHIAASAAPIASGTVGAGHGYALVPVAVLAALFAVGVRSAGSRPALLGLGLLGAVSLFIAIDRDGSQARREVLQRIGGHYVLTANQAAVGLYVETLGAVLLIATCACGLVLVGPARRNPTGQ